MDLIRIVVVDDHPLYREGVIRTLSEAGRFVIAGEAASGPEAEAVIARERPDVALLDISMPGGGIATLRRIMAQAEPPRCAMLTVSEEDDDILQRQSPRTPWPVIDHAGLADRLRFPLGRILRRDEPV